MTIQVVFRLCFKFVSTCFSFFTCQWNPFLLFCSFKLVHSFKKIIFNFSLFQVLHSSNYHNYFSSGPGVPTGRKLYFRHMSVKCKSYERVLHMNGIYIMMVYTVTCHMEPDFIMIWQVYICLEYARIMNFNENVIRWLARAFTWHMFLWYSIIVL